jgi:hypothetical protein
MIGYVTLGSNDVPRAAKFYDELLALLGAKRFMEVTISSRGPLRRTSPGSASRGPTTADPQPSATDR